MISGMNALFNLVTMGPPMTGLGDAFVWSFVTKDGVPFIGPAPALVLPMIAWGLIFAAFVFCQRIPVVGEGMAAPLPKVAAVGDDGETIVVDEEEDEAVQAERGATTTSPSACHSRVCDATPPAPRFVSHPNDVRLLAARRHDRNHGETSAVLPSSAAAF